MSAERLSGLCTRLAVPDQFRPVLSLTGGEPLLQHDFLSAWLPQMRPAFRIYLETNGIEYEALRSIVDLIDVVSMDIKFPSATGLRPFWEEHRKFIAASRGKELFIKTIMTNDTTQEDLVTAARLISQLGPTVPLIIQPATGNEAPSPSAILAFQELALGILGDVRVIPQLHKMLQVP